MDEVRRLRRWTYFLAVLAGAVCIGIGYTLDIAKFWGLFFMGIGSSVIGAVIFAWFAIVKDDFVDRVVGLGVVDMFHNRYDHLKDEFWNDLMSGARRHYRVLGTANHGYLNDAVAQEQTKSRLKAALEKRKKLDVEFLWLNPNSAQAQTRQNEEPRSTIRNICESIIFFWEFRESLNPGLKERFSLLEYTATPACGITWVDDRMVVTHNLPGRANLESPGVQLEWGRLERTLAKVRLTRKSSELYAVYSRSFTEVREAKSQPITATRITEIRSLYEQYRDTGPSEADLRKQVDEAEEREDEENE